MFYDRFVELCKDAGITPTAASREIGFSKGSVSYWKHKHAEGVDAMPDPRTAAKIATFFHVSVDYLLGRVDDPIDYEDPDLAADQSPSVLEHFGGDVRSSVEFQRAVASDVDREKERLFTDLTSRFWHLDPLDQGKVLAYMDGLLSADKYSAASKKDA